MSIIKRFFGMFWREEGRRHVLKEPIDCLLDEEGWSLELQDGWRITT